MTVGWLTPSVAAMSSRFACSLALVALLLPAAALAKKQKLAVLEIRALDEPSTKDALVAEDVVVTDLAKSGRFEVIGRSDVTTLLGFDKQRSLMGCTEGSCLAEIGGALGADYLVVGTLARVGTVLRIGLSVIDPKRNKAVTRESVEVKAGEDLLGGTHACVQALLESLPEKGAPAPPAAAIASEGVRAGTAKTTAAPSRVLPFTLLGGGLALGVAGGLVLKSGLAFNDADLTQVEFPTAEKNRKDALFKVRLGAGLAGAGVAALATGGLMLLLSPSSADASGGTLVHGLSPALLPGGVGFAASGRF